MAVSHFRVLLQSPRSLDDNTPETVGAAILAPELGPDDKPPGSFHAGVRPVERTSESIPQAHPCWPHVIPGRSPDLKEVAVGAGAPEALSDNKVLVEGAGSQHVNGSYTRKSLTLFTKDNDISGVRLRWAGAWYFEHTRGNKGIYCAVGTAHHVPKEGWHRWETAYSAPGELPVPTMTYLPESLEAGPSMMSLEAGPSMMSAASAGTSQARSLATPSESTAASRRLSRSHSETMDLKGFTIQELRRSGSRGSQRTSHGDAESASYAGLPIISASNPALRPAPCYVLLDGREPRGLPAAFKSKSSTRSLISQSEGRIMDHFSGLISAKQGNILKLPAKRRLLGTRALGQT